jgi:hypothetical protein
MFRAFDSNQQISVADGFVHGAFNFPTGRSSAKRPRWYRAERPRYFISIPPGPWNWYLARCANWHASGADAASMWEILAGSVAIHYGAPRA